MNKVYEIFTDRIISELEKGTIPWRQPWKESGRPVNLVSRKPYQGINVILLRSTCRSSPYWLTFKQAKDLGGHVRKGEKATPVVFWKWTERTERDPETGEERKDGFPILRYYSVFNADQVEGIAVPEEAPRPFNPVEHAEGIISAMPSCPEIQHRGDRAYYSPRLDQVVLPPKGIFDSENGYYSVAFHELTHSTGHSSRLHRFDTEDLAPFGSTDYSKEELVAELGASFLCAEAGIDGAVIPNSAAYIQNWLGAMRNDKRMVVLAAAQAQKAADYILDREAQEAIRKGEPCRPQ